MKFCTGTAFRRLWSLWIAFSLVATASNAGKLESAHAQEDSRNTTENNVNLLCDEKVLIDKEYVMLENGTLLLPDTNSIYNYGFYSVVNNTAYVCGPGNGSESLEESESVQLELQFSEEFLSCGHILIEPHEYKLLKNGTVHVETYNKNYEPTNYYIRDYGVYVCIPDFSKMHSNLTNHTTNGDFEKFGRVFEYISCTGITISIVSLFLHLLVFCFVAKVRNLPGCCLASLSLSLLVAYLCFVSSSFAVDKEECGNLGLCIYYFFLSSFFWMNSIAFDVWRSFRVVMRNLRISSHRVPWRRFLLYSAYSWLVPAVLAAVAKFGDSTDLLPVEYRPSFGQHICWFGQRKALLVFFAVPLCVVMVLNAVFFLDSSYVISRATMRAAHVNEAVLRKRFFMFTRLALLMGLTWIVGIVAGYVDNVFLWYLFVVLNTLQGLFIFIVFSCSTKVRGLFMKSISDDGKSRQGTSVRTISQASAL